MAIPAELRNTTWIAGIGLILWLVLVACLTSSCAPAATTLVAGDREITQISAGKLTADGGCRYFFVLRDTHTGVDYLAVVDAGIVELKPKHMKAEQ